MEKWGKERPRRGHEHPSFSSTLLDAIYRSMDEPDAGVAPEPSPAAAIAAPWRPAPAYRSAAASSQPAVTRLRSLPPISTSSSSDNSSYGGFSSSSEPESAASHRARIRPILTGTVAPARSAAAYRPPHPPLPPTQRVPSQPADHHREKTKSGSIRSRLRDLGRSKAPASPGARLAGLLNSLFAAAAKNPKKTKPSTAKADDSTCSTASSHSRSCLVKTPSTRRAPQSEDEGAKRSVRFHPVSVIVGEDLRPCGHKSVHPGDPRAEAEGKGKEEARRRVEELLRRLEDEEEDDEEEEEEEEEEMSDSSSDLFELENLTLNGAGGGYRDELPVYETTHPGTNRAISRGLVV